VNIGIVCYASVGGSGIVATELGRALAGRGHQVRLVSSELPFRFGDYHPGLGFHPVQAPLYPPLREPQYLLSLANKLVQVSREFSLDVIHAHYAIPHAAGAYLARQILATSGDDRVPKVITTLHGTDVTLVGADPSYSRTVTFCIDQSDGVTTVSESLKAETIRELSVGADIRVIPNFLDCDRYRRMPDPALRARLAGDDPATKLVIHVSNFRPVKRVDAVVEIFRRIHARVPARLVFVGEGPELAPACEQARELGLADAVESLGEQEQIVPLLSAADLALLPSATEGFGLAALEAMACETPVVASRVGGLPEVIEHGVSGYLHPPDDLAAMADSAVALLTDESRHREVAEAGRDVARKKYCADAIVPRYEDYYREVAGGG
jgi:N-acetyl-alpha-D-glucosaminyl L-malate synthase BshA